MTANVGKQAAAPSSLRLVLTLAIAGLVSGVAIIGIYETTLPTITANKARELREAVFKVLPGVTRMQALVYRDGRIVAMGSLGSAKTMDTLDARGLHILPGVIDTQVHFREPGLTHKEDLETGSRAAVAGGVTAVFEMPNTQPLTTSRLRYPRGVSTVLSVPTVPARPPLCA
jgi:hypothetical protein